MTSDAPSTDRPSRRQWDVLGAVALGGALGSVSRYGVSLALPTAPGTFPWSTLLVNVVGCLLLGALMSVITETGSPSRLLRPFVGVGALGGFTTLSTYVTDVTGLVVSGDPGLALTYLVITLGSALVATLLGISAARWVVRR